METLAMVRDLLFASKITATARATGVMVRILRDPAALRGAEGRLLIVDLNQPGAIEAAAEWGRTTGQPTIGFVSHTDTKTIDAARAAGITQVMARGGFVEALPRILSGQAEV